MLGMFQRRVRPAIRAQRKPRTNIKVYRDPGVSQGGTWVPNIVKDNMPTAPLHSEIEHSIDVVPNAQAKIDFRTSAVDRARGFLIASVPLYAAFALGVLVVAIALWSVPVLSFSALMVFWLSFTGAWLTGYAYTLMVSAEGIAWFEARAKWAILREEQLRRWNHYDRLTGGCDES